MKICFLIRALEYGGADRQLIIAADGLKRRGHTVTVIVFYGGGALDTELEQTGVPLISLGKRGRWDLIRPLWCLLKTVRRERPDVLHGYLPPANILAVVAALLQRGLRVAWGIRASETRLERYNWLHRLAHRVEKWLSKRADLIIANSYAGRRYSLAKGFPESRLKVVPNGIDVDRFQPNPDIGRALRREWGIGLDQRLIGLVGSLDPKKDHPNFIKAAALLVPEFEDLHFVCVGDGPASYRERLQAQAKELGLERRLTWAGKRGDIVAVHNALDVLCSASAFGEGFPNVIGEAMACGVYCVVTDVGDSAYIVGDLGIVVPPRDSQALASGLRKALQVKDDISAQVLSDRIAEHFSVEQLVERTEREMLWLLRHA